MSRRRVNRWVPINGLDHVALIVYIIEISRVIVKGNVVVIAFSKTTMMLYSK